MTSTFAERRTAFLQAAYTAETKDENTQSKTALSDWIAPQLERKPISFKQFLYGSGGSEELRDQIYEFCVSKELPVVHNPFCKNLKNQ